MGGALAFYFMLARGRAVDADVSGDRYRTLVDRILGMRLIYAERSVSRNVSFEFLNRQLVWEAFTVCDPNCHPVC